MMRVGLVGIGDAGTHQARALASLHSGGELRWVATCARDRSKLEAFLSAHAARPDMEAFTSLEALLAARGCDAVILATPDGFHVEQVRQVAGAGLHVLVEKPLALTLESGRQAVESARAAGVHLAVGYHLRHHAAHALMRARLAELIGAPRSLFIRWAWPDPAIDGWRAKGEGARFWSLAALGTHAIDLALWLTGEAPSGVSGLTEPPTGVDRAAEVSFRLGPLLAHVSCAVTHRASSRVLLTGEKGELEAVGTLGARGDGALLYRPPRGTPRPLAFELADPYLSQLRDFVLRAPHGFEADPAWLANLDVLERLDSIRNGR